MITPRSLLAAIPGKRELLARGLKYTGTLAALERSLERKPGLVVFTYHRVMEAADNPFYDRVVSATPASFRTRMDWIKTRFDLPILDEVLDHLETGRPWPKPAALVTLDDGTRDNFTTAAPILAERGIPALFFIPTMYLESPRLPWWDMAAYLIKQSRASRLTIPRPGQAPVVVNLEDMPRDQAVQAVIAPFVQEPIEEIERILVELRRQTQVPVDEAFLGRELFMNWDQARELVAGSSRFAIGSHGHGHDRLADLSALAQREELGESRRILEKRLSRKVIALAYPYGKPSDYTEETKTIAAEVGYRVAFCTTEGINDPAAIDRFAVKRFNCGQSDSVTLLRTRVALRAVLESLGPSAPCKNPGLRPGL